MAETDNKWEQLYRSGFRPWDTGRPDSHLTSVVRDHHLRPGRALDVGCGTGTNAIWLADQGFAVTGIDVSATALAMARAKPGADRCTFVLADFLELSAPAEAFDLVFDLGCFHIFDAPEQRSAFAGQVCRLLAPEGLWLCVTGSADGPQVGPPGRSALEIVHATEPWFHIVSLTATALDVPADAQLQALHLPTGKEYRGWSCLMRKRRTAQA